MRLKEIIKKPAFSFDDLFEQQIKIRKFEIDCTTLKTPEYQHYFDAYGENQMFDLITDLKEIDKPCLYWFEAENEEKASNLILALNDFRLNNPKNRTEVRSGDRSHLDVAVQGVCGTDLCGRRNSKNGLDIA